MARREFLTQLSQIVALPFLAAGVMQAQAQPSKKSLKIMMKSAWGSDDPTKAAFPFSHGLALSEAGHEVQIYLLGEAVSLMRKAVANSDQARGQKGDNLCLRRLFSRSWRHRRRSGKLWCQVWKPHNLRVFSRVGGPRHHGVKRPQSFPRTEVVRAREQFLRVVPFHPK
jgi:hypothetical protein